MSDISSKTSLGLSVTLIVSTLFTQACAHMQTSDIEVAIVSDNGSALHQYPVRVSGGSRSHRSYVEAVRNQRYGIRVRNRTDHRVGLVIAVDGRNIISGEKSWLGPNERMYILEPFEQATYKGWRTHQNRINRFFFTDVDDSYADAFGDRTAMGIIAITSYREKQRFPQPQKKKMRGLSWEGKDQARDEDRASSSDQVAETMSPRAGTGFGEHAHSQVRLVHFVPDPRMRSQYFLRYEWRQVLCDKGIIQCGRQHNRFWPECDGDGFVPYPENRQSGQG